MKVIWTTAGVLVEAVRVALGSFNPWVLAGCGVLLALAYAACVGLGAIYMRLVFSRADDEVNYENQIA